MAIDGGRSRTYALGRECILAIEGEEVTGAADMSLRETVTEVDATGFNHQVVSTIVTQRTYEISVSIPDMSQASRLYGLRWRLFDGFKVPNILELSLEGGLVEFSNEKFTIHDVDADEPLDGVVVPRFTLKQWGHD
jgi:hypothetical protein